MFKFSIREIILLTTIIALLITLYLNNQRQHHTMVRINDRHNEINSKLRQTNTLMEMQAERFRERQKSLNSTAVELRTKIADLLREKAKTQQYIDSLELKDENRHIQRLNKEIAQLNKDKEALRNWHQDWMGVAARQDKQIEKLKAELEKHK